jgi:toxin ParE1/3/4
LGRSEEGHRASTSETVRLEVNCRIVVKSKAEDEIQAAAMWYEARRSNLGFEFLAEVDRAFERIVENPAQFRLYEASVRIVYLRRFPFGVLYAHDDDTAFVLSVMRLSRRPERWRTG